MNVGKSDSVTTNATAPRPTATPKPTTTPQPRIGGDQLRLGTTPQPVPGPTPTATPDNTRVATATPAGPASGTTPRDASRQGENILDDSAGRKTYDAVSGVAGAADGARAIKPAVVAIETAAEAGKLGRLGGLGAKLAQAGGRLLSFGGNLASKVSWAAPLATKLANAAPFLGLGVAALDIGKAVIEDDPKKKEKAQGMAVLSTVSGIAGITAWAGFGGMAIAGVALAPIAVPAMIIGGVATAAALADQFLLDGKISRGITQGAKKVWSAITSL